MFLANYIFNRLGIFLTTLIASTLIILFSEMLKISSFCQIKKCKKLLIFQKIIFVKMKNLKWINFLTNMCQSCQGTIVYVILCLYCVLFFIIWHETLLHTFVMNLCGINVACVNPKNVTSQRDNHAFGDIGLHIIVLISSMYICINQMSIFFHFKHCRPIWSL